ncbi:MAG: hypothetical protein DSY42_02895 [Aquifex sp.]|nr:MAG: hypothetical protein DSY42_02895 [Aquifex sp.]
MKKFLSALGGVILLASSSYAVNKENTGCGLGYMIFKEQEGLVYELLAVTTNGTFGNQTFGITFGTLECKKPEKIANRKLEIFVAENMDELAQDIARGNGIYLETLADLMNIPEEERPQFFSKLQKNFDKIFSSENVTSADIIDAIVSL